MRCSPHPDPHKDLVRNVALYLQVPSIKEYWILDAQDADFPTLPVLPPPGQTVAGPDRGRPGIGRSCTTPLLPGFVLTLDTSD